MPSTPNHSTNMGHSTKCYFEPRKKKLHVVLLLYTTSICARCLAIRRPVRQSSIVRAGLITPPECEIARPSFLHRGRKFTRESGAEQYSTVLIVGSALVLHCTVRTVYCILYTVYLVQHEHAVVIYCLYQPGTWDPMHWLGHCLSVVRPALNGSVASKVWNGTLEIIGNKFNSVYLRTWAGLESFPISLRLQNRHY